MHMLLREGSVGEIRRRAEGRGVDGRSGQDMVPAVAKGVLSVPRTPGQMSLNYHVDMHTYSAFSERLHRICYGFALWL